MCLTNCRKCKYFNRKPHHSGDIVCSLNPAYASMWQRLNTLDEFTLNSLPVDDCRDFELDPSLESKTIPLYLSFNALATLARESNNPVIRDALADLLIHLELSLTVDTWQAIANSNTDPSIRIALEAEGIEPIRDPWIHVDSSCIDAIAYTQSNSTLKIRFNRETYQYNCVPYQLYLDLLDADSHGTFYNRHIKDAFPCRLL